MILKKWNDLPESVRLSEVRPYYDVLYKKRSMLILKRIFDLLLALLLLIILAVPMSVIAILIKIDSEGSVFYKQERITTYGKTFKIHKFRTMISNAEKIGTTVTISNDSRITKIGHILRKLKLDELPQILDVLSGNMTFVGTRPEVVKYVEKYQPVFMATLLLPAGITSEASIRYKNEDKLLTAAENADQAYVNQILPVKMKWNLESIEHFHIFREILTLCRTICAMLGKDYKP